MFWLEILIWALVIGSSLRVVARSLAGPFGSDKKTKCAVCPFAKGCGKK